MLATSKLPVSLAESRRFLLGSTTEPSEIAPAGDANADPKTLVPRLRNWKPGAPPTLSPIRARLCRESMTTPQFVHDPAENVMVPLPPLVTVVVRVVPLNS